jgi:hypothetical protein
MALFDNLDENSEVPGTPEKTQVPETDPDVRLSKETSPKRQDPRVNRPKSEGPKLKDPRVSKASQTGVDRSDFSNRNAPDTEGPKEKDPSIPRQNQEQVQRKERYNIGQINQTPIEPKTYSFESLNQRGVEPQEQNLDEARQTGVQEKENLGVEETQNEGVLFQNVVEGVEVPDFQGPQELDPNVEDVDENRQTVPSREIDVTESSNFGVERNVDIGVNSNVDQSPPKNERQDSGLVESQTRVENVQPDVSLSSNLGVNENQDTVSLSSNLGVVEFDVELFRLDQTPIRPPNVRFELQDQTKIDPRLIDSIDSSPSNTGVEAPSDLGVPVAENTGVEIPEPDAAFPNEVDVGEANIVPLSDPLDLQIPSQELIDPTVERDFPQEVSIEPVENTEVDLAEDVGVEEQAVSIPLQNQNQVEDLRPQIEEAEETQLQNVEIEGISPVENSGNIPLEELEIEEVNVEYDQSGEVPTFPEEILLDRSELPGLPTPQSLQERNERSRDREFEQFSLSNGFLDQPWITTRPDDPRTNLYEGSRVVPGREHAEDQVRLSKFLASPRGILFNAKQSTLQTQNTRRLTRIYDPAALRNSALSYLVSDTRHVSAGEGLLGSLVSRLDGLTSFVSGLSDLPKDSTREEEIRALTDGQGYLRNQTPRFEGEGLTGAQYRERARQALADQVEDLRPDFYTLQPRGPRRLQRDRQEILEGSRDSFIGMKPITSTEKVGEGPLGTPITRETETFDTYNPLRTREDFLENFEDGESPITEKTVEDESDLSKEQFNPYPDVVRGEEPGPDEGVPKDENFEPEDGYFILYRREGDASYGYPNYSSEEKFEDLVNSKPIEEYQTTNGEIDDSEVLTGPNGEEFKDVVPFRIYDLINRRRLIFRSYLQGISISNETNWSSNQYAGRPEKYHIYGGNSRSLSFSFSTFAQSEKEFENLWDKINYLNGLVYPSNIQTLRGGGAYMLAPFLKITLGDLLNKWPGFFQSLDISFPDESPWETRSGRRLPKQADISCTYTLIEREFPNTGDRLFDGSFIQDFDNA